MGKWEENIRKITPYVPGDQPNIKGMIKINTNENPYPPSPEVGRLIRQFDHERLRLYPHPDVEPLNACISEYYGLQPGMVFTGVGSDDVLATAFMTFFNGDRPIVFPEVTYSFYSVWAELYRIPYVRVPLDEGFRIRREGYYAPNGGVVLANPNAPTGICEDVELIEDVIRHNQDVVVIIDEAYVAFGGESVVRLIGKYENLLVVHTMSKSRSMAGMRIGYAMGGTRLIRALNDMKHSYNSYTMSHVAIECGMAALGDEGYFADTVRKIINTREWVRRELTELGFTYPDSKANFVFVRHGKVGARELYGYLKGKDIFVRYFDVPGIDDYLRITIGTDEQMEAALSEIRKYLCS